MLTDDNNLNEDGVMEEHNYEGNEDQNMEQ